MRVRNNQLLMIGFPFAFSGFRTPGRGLAIVTAKATVEVRYSQPERLERNQV
jgi:hypothetical protein